MPGTIGDAVFSNFISRISEKYQSKNKEQLGPLNVLLDSLFASSSKKKIDVKIKILAKKLLFTESYLKELYDFHNPQFFREFIVGEWEKDHNTLELAKKNFKEICLNYRLEDQWAVSEKSISIQSLIDIVKECTRVLHNLPASENSNAHVYMKNLNCHLLTKQVNEKLLIVQWNGKIKIKQNNPDFLGKGAFGIVQRVYDVSNGCFAALKIASTNYLLEIGKEGITNEIRKLTYIHRNKLQRGIQEPPYTNFDVEKDNKIYAYLEKLYNGCDLEKAITSKFLDPEGFSKERGLDLIETLVRGLIKLHFPDPIRGCIIHGDIKIDNIFVESKGNDINLVIGDLGGSIFSKDAIDFNNVVNLPFGTITSERSFTRLDMEKLIDAVANSNKPQWIYHLKKREFFSLGIVLWIVLSGQDPFPRDLEVVWAETESDLLGEDFISKKYGNKITNQLKLILSEDPDLRPTKKEFLNIIKEEKELENKKRKQIAVSSLYSTL